MNSSDLIIEYLNKISEILHLVNEKNWSSVIDDYISQLSNLNDQVSKANIARCILRMYGGMGSFNDLVLYKNNQVCFSENEELDRLKSSLFEECKKILTK